MKRPEWRTADLATILRLAPEVVEKLLKGLESVCALWPHGHLVQDFEVSGSYARGLAQLHSDLDINVSVGTWENRAKAIQLCKENPEAVRQATREYFALVRSLGVRIDLSMQHPALIDVEPHQQIYRLREGKWYHRDLTKTYSNFYKWSKDTGAYRTLQKGQGDYRRPQPGAELLPDPWEADIPTWQKRYGTLYQVFGETPDTVWTKL